MLAALENLIDGEEINKAWENIKENIKKDIISSNTAVYQKPTVTSLVKKFPSVH